MSFDSTILSPRNPRDPSGKSIITTGVQLQIQTLNDIQNTFTTPPNPVGAISLIGVMAGLAVSFTPNKTGRIKVTVQASIQNNTAGDGGSVQISQGTGTAPVNGAAITGTQFGKISQSISPAVGNINSEPAIAMITGLVIGTAIWIDLVQAAITGGTATITNIVITIDEY